jgi:heterodisulfide reductase subunit B
MKYSYYPGCSLKATGVAYDTSTVAVARALGLDLPELDDWNCCGTTSYMSVKEDLAFALSARNLALAEQAGADCVVAPCSACYTNLRKTHEYFMEFPEVREKVTAALAAGGLEYKGTIAVRHLLDIVVNDVGYEKIHQAIKTNLEGLKVAPYYGCQMIRPKGAFDDPEEPVALDNLVAALGCTVVDYPVKTRCCGASLIGTKRDLALRMCRMLLLAARQNNADIIVTTCPLCQMNLDAFQGDIAKTTGERFDIPVIYFTQLMGVAFGLRPEELELDKVMVPAKPVLAQYVRG